MSKRFHNCGLSNVTSDEGFFIEYSPMEVAMARALAQKSTEPSLMRVVFEAIFERMATAKEFAHCGFEKFSLFRFRPHTGFVEEGSGVAYEIFQMPLFSSDGCEYAYIVADRINGTYRLRGVSKPVPNATPEDGWCNSDEYWLYWNDIPADSRR